MKVVVDNTTEDVARKTAIEDVGAALRTLTANLMRVARGSGKPGEILSQVDDFVIACRAFKSVGGEWPSAEDLARSIEMQRDESWVGLKSGDLERFIALRSVLSSSLQVTASEMLGQRSQATRAEADLGLALRRLDDAVQAEYGAWRAPQGGEAPTSPGKGRRLRRPAPR